ncbi:MAG TPA: hypothetical protein VHX44_19625, partial [Planctomycetota bacterium]|nr:hypothetical protein [Planctomycetota bacterium]
MTTRIFLLVGLTTAAMAADQEDFIHSLNLEAHGFVSFGYLDSARNNWLGPTMKKTSEFWKTAANVIAHPM